MAVSSLRLRTIVSHSSVESQIERTDDLLSLHVPRQKIWAMKGLLTPGDFALVRCFGTVVQFVPSILPVISTDLSSTPCAAKGVKYTDDARLE